MSEFSMLFCINIERKTSACGSQLAGLYVGHIRIVLCVSETSGSTGMTHFNPDKVVLQVI